MFGGFSCSYNPKVLLFGIHTGKGLGTSTTNTGIGTLGISILAASLSWKIVMGLGLVDEEVLKYVVPVMTLIDVSIDSENSLSFLSTKSCTICRNSLHSCMTYPYTSK